MADPTPPSDGDWQRWSEGVALEVQARAEALMAKHALLEGTPYGWDLQDATILFETPGEEVEDSLTFGLQVVGTRAHGVFTWGWANPGLPAIATSELEAVRAFGAAHDLPLLTEAEVPADASEALEMLAIAAHVLNADGVWIEPASTADDRDADLYFLLFE
jgi:hypothetical protein